MQFWLCDHKVGGKGWVNQLHIHTTTADNLLDTLLTEFRDLFVEPRGLPPLRPCDHRIHLLLGTEPMAVRPDRYPALHKEELERYCRDMLSRGNISTTLRATTVASMGEVHLQHSLPLRPPRDAVQGRLWS